MKSFVALSVTDCNSPGCGLQERCNLEMAYWDDLDQDQWYKRVDGASKEPMTFIVVEGSIGSFWCIVIQVILNLDH